MRTGLTKAQKITEITFDEKEPLIHIRTHNTDLKKRLAAYAAHHPTECRQLDANPDTVCGRTDTDYPNLEFRYCSKCNGYYCYCMDHINNHVHIQ